MKRIFIIQNTPLSEPLPLSIYLTDLLRNFKKNKSLEINLIIGRSKEIPKEVITLCSSIYQFPSNTYSIKDNVKFSFFVKKVLKKENAKKKVDIVHCLYPNSSLLGAILFKNLDNKQTRVIYDVRSPWIEMSIERGFISPLFASIYKKFLYFEEKALCKQVDNFVFITEGLRDYYFKKCKIESKPFLISPSGVDTNLFRKMNTSIRKKYGIKHNQILIGSVGGIAKIRKLDVFLDIFKDVTKMDNHVKLMFVGSGDALEDLKNKTRYFNLQDKVIFAGSVPHKDIPKYISAFDFGLCHLPDRFIYENSFPLKILEYLSCGIPVLASDIKAHRGLKKNLKNIFIYGPKDDIKEILRKSSYKKNTSLRDYSWNSLTKLYENLWIS